MPVSEQPDHLEDNWFSEENATFGDRLAGGREAAGLSQAELSRRLGIKAKTLRAWENDLSAPRANRLSMLAGLLNVSIRWLLTGEGDGVQAPSEQEESTPGAKQLLLELRQMRSEAKQMAERIGQIEKRLRKMLDDD